jgi:rhodanese-related sulfurtransferase
MDETGYSGDITPEEAWGMLASDASAMLVDVRTDAEWRYVGVPDLSSIGKAPVFIAWQLYPGLERNPIFSEALFQGGVRPEHKVILLCRSGVRSKAAAEFLTQKGYPICYNVKDGFEGQIDLSRHRGNGGWRADGLPWVQS